MQLVDHNYRIYCENNHIKLGDDFDARKLIEEVLDKCQYTSKRIKDLDIEDFMKILLEFNLSGVHFC